MATQDMQATAAVRLNGERRFHLLWMAAAMLVIVAGFAPSWFLRPWIGAAHMLPLTPLVWVHSLVFTAWLALAMTQVGLISVGNLRLHRALGRLALLFMVALPAVGMAAGLHGAARHAGPPFIPAANFLAVPLFAVPAMGVLIWLGYRNRFTAAAHKRYMLMAMVVFIPPGSGRLLFGPPMLGLLGIPTLFALAVAAHDVATLRHVHRATWIGGGIALASLWGAIWAMDTAAWVGIARASMALWN